MMGGQMACLAASVRHGPRTCPGRPKEVDQADSQHNMGTRPPEVDEKGKKVGRAARTISER